AGGELGQCPRETSGSRYKYTSRVRAEVNNCMSSVFDDTYKEDKSSFLLKHYRHLIGRCPTFPNTSRLRHKHTKTGPTTSGTDDDPTRSPVHKNTMDNTTATDTFIPFGEESSTIFKGLTKAEEVVVCAAIVVGILAVLAIILRLTMPFVRRKYRKSKATDAGLKGNRSSSDLLGAATPSSSASRASTISGGSQLDYWKPQDNDTTTITTISNGSYDNPKSSVYGNVRSDALSLPVYLPKKRSEENLKQDNSVTLLNEELTAVISTPTLQRLQSLNLNETYRDNWDRSFDPANHHVRSLSYVTHPSESRKMPEIPQVHRGVPKEYQRQHAVPDVVKTRF
ncbi:hypothetical protein BaRGS_00010922, partial [Batillaria attramentaria]